MSYPSFVKTNAAHAGVTTRWASEEQANLRVAMSSTEALSIAIDTGLLHGKRLPPGAVIERLPAEVREALRRLTSDEARRMRP